MCISLLSHSQITANEKVSCGTEQTALHLLPVGKKYCLAPCFILPFSLAVDLPFLLPDSVTTGSPASFPNFIFIFFFNLAGLDAGKIKQVGTIRGQESTRRIGDYKVKYGYTDIELLRSEKLPLWF